MGYVNFLVKGRGYIGQDDKGSNSEFYLYSNIWYWNISPFDASCVMGIQNVGYIINITYRLSNGGVQIL